VNSKRAAVYARVSTAEQVDGTSLGSQVERAEAHITVQGWTPAGRFVDEGVSGAKASRPALDLLLTAVRAGTIDVVVVAKLDRIGRSMRHLAALLGELDDRQVVLVSVAEAFDSSTPSGRLQRNMLGSFAEFEREQIRERMSSGRDVAVRAGKWVSTNAPFGYRIDTTSGQRPLAIEPSQAETIRLAVDLFVTQRMTTGQVATELNNRGHRPPQTGRWTGHQLRALFRNSDHLAGTWTWRHPRHRYQAHPIPVTIPAIIDTTTLDRLQARVAETTRHQTHRRDKYLLAGRIFTPHGTLMYGLTNPSRMYRCSEVFANNAPPGGRTCDCRQINADMVEETVWEEVTSLLSDKARLLTMAGMHLARTSTAVTTSDEDLTAIDRRIHRLERAAGEKLSQLLANGLDPAIAGHAASGLTDQLAAARRHRQQVAVWQAANADRQDRTQRLLAMAGRAQEILPDADTATRARIVAVLDVKVRVERWEPCPDCGGRGYLSRPAPRVVGEAGPGRPRGNADKICQTCRRHRWLPRLVIEGMVPDANLETVEADDSPRWPFRVVNGDG
jgi:site-specific DNA recombinase